VKKGKCSDLDKFLFAQFKDRLDTLDPTLKQSLASYAPQNFSQIYLRNKMNEELPLDCEINIGPKKTKPLGLRTVLIFGPFLHLRKYIEKKKGEDDLTYTLRVGKVPKQTFDLRQYDVRFETHRLSRDCFVLSKKQPNEAGFTETVTLSVLKRLRIDPEKIQDFAKELNLASHLSLM